MGTPVGVWLVVGSVFFFGAIGVTAGCGSGSSGGGGNDDTFVSTQLALPCASVSNCNGRLTCSASC